MKNIIRSILGIAGMMAAAMSVQAASVQTPSGDMPLIHWAVVESADGQMGTLQKLGAAYVAPEVAKEEGTYALYGVIDAGNPNIMRVLEFYRDEEAYRTHVSSKGFHAYDAARQPYLKGVRILEAEGIALEQKDSGTGTCVYTELVQVRPEALQAFTQRLTQEIRRAVAEDEQVIGLYATAEKDDPTRIHMMGIFLDKNGYGRYIHSQAYQAFYRDIKDMIVMQNRIENLPASITLSRRGVQ